MVAEKEAAEAAEVVGEAVMTAEEGEVVLEDTVMAVTGVTLPVQYAVMMVEGVVMEDAMMTAEEGEEVLEGAIMAVTKAAAVV